MSRPKTTARIFGAVGVSLAAAAVAVSLLAQKTEPVLLVRPQEAAQCAEEMLSRLCAGDYAGAAYYLYGSPKLDTGKELSNDLTRQIWDAFTGSLEYELVGDSYAAVNGVSQDVCIRGMEIASVTDGLQQRAQALLEKRIDEAETMDEIYTEDLSYRADFLSNVLHDAASEAVDQNAQIKEHDLTLSLVYEKDRWWVVPDQPLLSAISGGMVG